MSMGEHGKCNGDKFVDEVCLLVISNENFRESQMPVKPWCIVVNLKRLLTILVQVHFDRLAA